MSAQAAPQASASQDVRLQLRVATANVLSLGPEGHKAAAAAGLVETGRTAQLQDSFASQGIQMCGLQETRTKDDAVVQLSRYYAVNSACTSQGHNGCALWVATGSPFEMDGAPHMLRPASVSVVFSYPTALLVAMCIGPVRIHVLVAHAPL